MTTLAELVEQTPAAARGQSTQIVHGDGVWRHVLELADPAAGASVVWYDITPFWCGLEYTRGADGYLGRYRSSVANLELCTDTDALAPWNDDTSPTFGTHVELGPGLLIRSGLIRVSGGVVVEWNPRFTLKVESWGDAAYSRGAIRRHRIVVRDLFTSFVTLPLPASTEENWSDRMFRWLTDTDWPYGSLIYGAQFESDTTTPILTLPDRPASSSAINELDATLDPVGLVWYTDRYGHLVVRPRVDDTFHADAFAAGATGDEYPGDVPPVDFTWFGCSEPPGSTFASYAQDNSTDPFGLDKTERWVINHVKITTPGSPFDDDDPISIQRYDRKTMQATWIAENPVVAAQILETRADAVVEARPLHTTVELPGFYPGPARIDYLDYVAIQHRNNDGGLTAYANGWLRQYREQMAPRGCDLDWSLTLTVDVYNTSSDVGLLPVEDLTVVGVSDVEAEFSWSNPAQTIAPTATQVRLLDLSPIWITTTYPITGLFWGSLTPATGYQFQVRLIRAVDGVITHVSPTRTVDFATDEATIPVIDDGTGTLPEPDEGCELEWELRESVDGSTFSVIDSGTITEPPFTVDLSGYTFDADKLYQLRSREVCEGVPGAWTISNLFVGECSEPPALADPPYDDADFVAYWPAVCPPDTIVEAVTEQEAITGPQFDTFVIDGDGNVVLVADGDGVVAFGTAPDAVATIVDDCTIAAKVLVSTQPDAPVVLFHAAGQAIEAQAEGANWTVRARALTVADGLVTITAGAELDFGTWYDVALVHDVAAGDLLLYVDGVLEASALGTVGERINNDLFEIGQSDNGLITNCAVWDRVLAAAELPGYEPPAYEFFDDFERADNSSLGANWSEPDGAIPVVSGTAHRIGGGRHALWNTAVSDVDHYVEIDDSVEDAARLVAAWVRGSTSGGIQGYRGYYYKHVAPVEWRLERVHNGVATQIAVAPYNLPTSPFRIRLEAYNIASGVLLALYEQVSSDWVLRLAYFDEHANKKDTQTGVGMFLGTDTLATSNPAVADNWAAGALVEAPPVLLAGGRIYSNAGYVYNEFTTVGTATLKVLAGSVNVDHLVVAGGGAGARGGGGAGGVNIGTATVSSDTTVTVGDGGATGGTSGGSHFKGTNGGSSSLGALATAFGGGAGGGDDGSTSGSRQGSNGGSGGGGGTNGSGTTWSAGTGVGGQGTAGGTSGAFPGTSPFPSGGGGGASTAGSNAPSAGVGGAGGNGVEWPTGSGQYWGGGGGGDVFSPGTAGAGGTGGGGSNGGIGTPGTGGGGGGGSNGQAGGSGGSGRVTVRYPI